MREEEERYLRAREHYRLQKFNARMDEVRIAKLYGERVRTAPVWFIEDCLAGSWEQVWGPKDNYYEHGQAAAGFEGPGGHGEDSGAVTTEGG